MTDQEVIENAYKKIMEKIFENYYIDQDHEKFVTTWNRLRYTRDKALKTL